MLDRVFLLVTSPDARGGIARATATLANALALTHQVEMIALRRRSGGTRYWLDPAVKVSCVLDEAAPAERSYDRLPSATPGGDVTGAYSALIDLVLPRVLGALPPGIIISTRAVLHLEIARHAPSHCIRIAQDHVNLQFREAKASLDPVAQAIDHLDAYVVLTEADAETYRRSFPAAANRVHVIRNPAPWPVLASPKQRRQIVVAVGKLGGRKGFDRLIDAYRPLAKRRPNWQLHIYGDGPKREQLSRLIMKSNLGDAIFLKGHSDRIEEVLEEASIFALTSRYEGLPMVLIEAMTKGLPIVSLDCPHGPAEIVVDKVTGSLVPDNDVRAFRIALLKLMDQPQTRARMSEQTLRHAEQYQPDRITQAWRDLFDTLTADRARTFGEAGAGTVGK